MLMPGDMLSLLAHMDLDETNMGAVADSVADRRGGGVVQDLQYALELVPLVGDLPPNLVPPLRPLLKAHALERIVLQPSGIYPVDWVVVRIAIQVQPALNPDRVRRDEPPRRCVIVALLQVIQPQPRLTRIRVLRLVP